MRRILLVLAVAAMMAVMMVSMAAPAFADKFPERAPGSCGQKGVSQDRPLGSDFLTFNSGQGQGGIHNVQGHDCPEGSPVGQP